MRFVVRFKVVSVLVSLVVLCGGCDESTQSLVSVPTVQEANEIVVALDTAGIRATIEQGASQRKTDFMIRTARASETAARRVLVEKGLPREPFLGYEQFPKESGFWMSQADRQQHLLIATAAELARTLEAIDGVTRARVHITSTSPSGPQVTFKPVSSASVTVVLRTARPVETLALTSATTRPTESGTPQDKIRELVARSVPDVPIDRVTLYTSVTTPALQTATDDAPLRSERDAAVNTVRQLRIIAIALAGLAVVSVVIVLLQAVKARRTL